ncbi:hypothetical protein [Ruegeria arenilitoris]|uniref:hypothetical protein n=2 Tax=Ruegeria arenilitoris TaxID=1173585 RepID=UPI00147BDAE6|nr:hypothetical protein [Ruegeria arenilitoris]
MKRLMLIGATALFAAPAAAQDEGGKSLMEQGAELFFEGLRKEMEPALEDLLGLAEQFGPAMQSFIEEMGPALAEIGGKVKDWSAYEAPEMLPNGDIIIRRKPDVPDQPDEVAPKEDDEGATDI